ncbi:peptide-methionine (S)-S-oxide reductase MsrA [Pseudomonas sp. SDO5522_S412]|jgi:peptide-methionine (S)-S-oxide reductase|uniref:peptide-methionine (S)-S-oxide reductase MsrA n=1 Tax=unclassified Pseudomonas TaxID=196821 RepID=UPI0003688D10|nr:MULTISPECIES: peptide-methionine (S)-S-oxide reductase MsrA [unclassified Pseudomonas]QBQ10656.1 peptide-methionine (S)-S-oxide reductase [Pseudomonas sp. SXM-1]
MSEHDVVEQATFGAGCFWGAQASFNGLPGVLDSRVGFARSSQGDSPLIEVVQVDFDARVIPFTQLVSHFWTLHDPTSVDRQGADIGVKYRSAVFFTTAQQAQLALVAKQKLDASGQLGKPVATVIVPLAEFQLADEEHQNYLEKHGGTCSI